MLPEISEIQVWKHLWLPQFCAIVMIEDRVVARLDVEGARVKVGYTNTLEARIAGVGKLVENPKLIPAHPKVKFMGV